MAVTTGSSGGFLYSFLAAFDAGDTVVMARPGYPAYRNMLAALGVPRDRTAVRSADPLPADGRAAGRARRARRPAWCSRRPANPTGTMVDAAELAALVAWCDAHGTRLVSDEIYHGITYGAPAASAWQSSRTSIVVNSFSKYFSMTGWRIGWLLVPDELIDAVDRLAGNFAICPPALSQLAAVAAFDAYDELDANVARYAVNRALALDGLRAIGVDRLAPADGAFYVWADVSQWTSDSMAFSARLLAETGVAIAPGIDFDPVEGGHYVRMCFAGDADDITRAIELLGDWLAASTDALTHLSSDEPSTGLTSMIGVPSKASSCPTVIRSPSTASTRTRCSPIGFGRSGERVVNTPSCGRVRSLRGCTTRVSRSARCSQVRTRSSMPGWMSRAASATSAVNTSTASGAPSSPCRGASARSVNELSTCATGRNTKSMRSVSAMILERVPLRWHPDRCERVRRFRGGGVVWELRRGPISSTLMRIATPAAPDQT